MAKKRTSSQAIVAFSALTTGKELREHLDQAKAINRYRVEWFLSRVVDKSYLDFEGAPEGYIYGTHYRETLATLANVLTEDEARLLLIVLRQRGILRHCEGLNPAAIRERLS